MKHHSIYPLLTFLFVALTAFASNENSDSPFLGNRRPGILEEPSETPTGENAQRYQQIGDVGPDELLDFLSENSETSSLDESAPLETDSIDQKVSKNL